MKHKVLTLCFVERPGEILLGMKKRGFGEGKWNGFGGKVEEGETIEQACVRELREEAGIEAHNLKSRGVLNFLYPFDDKSMEVHLFSTSEFSGEPIESEEMKPQWFAHAEIPFNSMWADDPYWLPEFIKGKNIQATFNFSDYSTIEKHEVRITD